MAAHRQYTHGRACLIASAPAAVTLNSISIANSSSSPTAYSVAKCAWMRPSAVRNSAVCASPSTRAPSATRFERATTVVVNSSPAPAPSSSSSGTAADDGLVTSSSPTWALT